MWTWTHWGCDGIESHSFRRKIFHVDVAALMAIISMALFAVPNALTENSALIMCEITRNCRQLPEQSMAVPYRNRIFDGAIHA